MWVYVNEEVYVCVRARRAFTVCKRLQKKGRKGTDRTGAAEDDTEQCITG